MTTSCESTPQGLKIEYTLVPGQSISEFLTLKKPLKVTGIRIEGTRLYEIMIRNMMIGNVKLVTVGISLSIIHLFKEYIDKQVMSVFLFPVEDKVSYQVENIGSCRLTFTLFIDGDWNPSP